jgi:hypothetical protein
MKYRLLFFMSAITLLVMVGLSTFELLGQYLEAYAALGDLFCPIRNVGPPVFLLLIVMNLLLIVLYFRPENDFLWWLNLVGLSSLMITITTNFTPNLVLALLSFGFGLAYRRVLGLQHIWHWRGVLALVAAVVAGFGVVFFGLDWGWAS